jgi:non-homologous end joining protein Ku
MMDDSVHISKNELALSSALIDTYAGDLDLSAYRDEYPQQLRTLIDGARSTPRASRVGSGRSRDATSFERFETN